jgi:hypothetical protein
MAIELLGSTVLRSLNLGTGWVPTSLLVPKKPTMIRESWWRRGELNRPRDSQPKTEKVLDSTAKSKSSGHFLEGKKGPKMPEKDPDNPEKNRTGSGRLNGDLPDEIVDAEQAGKAPIGVDRFPRMLDC